MLYKTRMSLKNAITHEKYGLRNTWVISKWNVSLLYKGLRSVQLMGDKNVRIIRETSRPPAYASVKVTWAGERRIGLSVYNVLGKSLGRPATEARGYYDHDDLNSSSGDVKKRRPSAGHDVRDLPQTMAGSPAWDRGCREHDIHDHGHGYGRGHDGRGDHGKNLGDHGCHGN